jgi:hypothetical protein
MNPHDLHASNAFAAFLQEMALSPEPLPSRLWEAFSRHLIGGDFFRSLNHEARLQANEFAEHYFGFESYLDVRAEDGLKKVDTFNNETTRFAFADLMILREVVESSVRKSISLGAPSC